MLDPRMARAENAASTPLSGVARAGRVHTKESHAHRTNREARDGRSNYSTDVDESIGQFLDDVRTMKLTADLSEVPAERDIRLGMAVTLGPDRQARAAGVERILPADRSLFRPHRTVRPIISSMGSSGPPFHDMFEIGRMARRAGASFFENPVHVQPPLGDDGFDAWVDDGAAWAAGWLHEDAGRTEAIQRLLRVLALVRGNP
jgi:hypothetical protein